MKEQEFPREDDWVACLDCDALYQRPTKLPFRARVQCHQCGAVLYHHQRGGLAFPLALALSVLVSLIILNTFPVLGFRLNGQEHHTLLWSGVLILQQFGLKSVAWVILLTSMIFPFLHILLLLFVLLPLHWGRQPWHGIFLFRWAIRFAPWGMTGVYLLAVLVAVVKLQEMATVVVGPAVWALFSAVFLTTLCETSLNIPWVWQKLRDCKNE